MAVGKMCGHINASYATSMPPSLVVPSRALTSLRDTSGDLGQVHISPSVILVVNILVAADKITACLDVGGR